MSPVYTYAAKTWFHDDPRKREIEKKKLKRFTDKHRVIVSGKLRSTLSLRGF